ncbi:MAG: hypothetical protein WD824_18215 [Cyclobacteriaceae bacterium]
MFFIVLAGCQFKVQSFKFKVSRPAIWVQLEGCIAVNPSIWLSAKMPTIIHDQAAKEESQKHQHTSTHEHNSAGKDNSLHASPA